MAVLLRVANNDDVDDVDGVVTAVLDTAVASVENHNNNDDNESCSSNDTDKREEETRWNDNQANFVVMVGVVKKAISIKPIGSEVLSPSF